MHAPTTTAGNHPGFLLVPKVLRLPGTIPFPVGLVMRPSEFTPSNIQTLLADLTGAPTDTYQWMDNPMLIEWLMAAANDPSAFAIPVWPHSILTDAFPLSAPAEAFSIRAHQEWSILNQLIWDHAFAHASGQRGSGGNQALGLTHYANALTAANNSDSPNPLATQWGFSINFFKVISGILFQSIKDFLSFKNLLRSAKHLVISTYDSVSVSD